MTLASGSRLGPYEVLSPLGSGGMGEVWKARDTRLDRTVAIKILPEALAKDPDLRARLEREARVLSALSHPHICALFDVGREGNVEYLVMEHLVGETLAERLAKGPLPPDQVLRTGGEIASALDAAHRSGLVHRDLKPANVMLMKSGAKLLDFGLARVQESAAAAPASLLATAARPLTEKGTVLGTFQYMSPEQLEGKEADARSDIFALGAVLYEMATGRKAFEGKSQASLIAAILASEPPAISTVSRVAPPALDRLVRTCLAKDPDERWQSAHDVGAQLRAIAEGSQAGAPAAAPRSRRMRERLAWAAATLAAAIALALAVTPRDAGIAGPVRLALALPADGAFTRFACLTPSPDGKSIALIAAGKEERGVLAVRALGSAALRVLAGTEGAWVPFWSPDGRSLGFFADGKLQRVDLAGGPPRALAEAKVPFGGTWGKEGVIVFGTGFNEPLSRVPASGGEVSAATKLYPGEEAHRWPSFLPDGRRFVFLADAPTTADHFVRLAALGALESRRVVPAVSNPWLVPPDLLLFVRARTLLAQRIDAKKASAVGEPVAVGEQLAEIGMNHRFDFGASPQLLAYQSAVAERKLVWFDRSGARLGTVGGPDLYDDFRLSPDGRRLAFSRTDQDGRSGNLWVMDIARGTVTRLTSEPGGDYAPLWSPRGEKVLFGSMRGRRLGDVYETPSGGGGPDTLILSAPGQTGPSAWTPDGKLVVVTLPPDARPEIDVVTPGEKTLRPIVKNGFVNDQADVSPDGKLLAWVSNESGRAEVYVRSLADGARVQVSTAGGEVPIWSRDGRELFFRWGTTIFSSVVAAAPALEASDPKPLVNVGVPFGYDVAPDGRRFLVKMPADENAGLRATVVLDWRKGLAR